MEISFDPAKSEKNRLNRNLPFTCASELEFATAKLKAVQRNGERRLTEIGLYDQKVHFLRFNPTSAGFRVISFRLASRRERREYEEFQDVLGYDGNRGLDG